MSEVSRIRQELEVCIQHALHTFGGRRIVQRLGPLTAPLPPPPPWGRSGQPGGSWVSYHNIIMPACHIIIPSYHRNPLNYPPPDLKSYFAKSQEKNRNRPCYPSAKSRRDLKMIGSGVIFRDGSAGEVQNIAAPPKQAVCENSFLANFSDENFCQRFCRFFFPGVEK